MRLIGIGVFLGGLACSEAAPDSVIPTDARADITPLDASSIDGSSTDAPNEAAAPAPLYVLVGSGDGKIRVFSVVLPTGALTQVGVASPGGNPSFLAMDPQKRHVYAVDEANDQVRAFSFDPKSGALADLGAPVGSGGAGPTHLSIDPSGKVVLVANYTGGTVSVFPIMGDGALGSASDTRSSGTMTHHAVVNPAGGFAFVSALGADSVVQYKLDVQTGKLTPNGAVSPPASSGPRHLAFRPDEKFAYGINETASSITTYAFDKGTGMLTAGTTVSTLPGNFAGQNTCAEIVVHPTGGTVYGSNRGHDSIVTFASDATTGALTLVAHTATGGKTPRSFAMDPAAKLVFVANQGSGTVTTFTMGANGVPIASGAPVTVPSPTFVGAWRVP